MPRIPGLTDFPAGVSPAADDEMIIWKANDDVTRGITLATLGDFFVAYADLPGGDSSFVSPPSDGTYYAQRNAAWTAVPIQADAASDGTYYARRNAAWSAAPIQADATNNGKPYVRQSAAWALAPAVVQFAVSDETTALTTGTAKITLRAPHAMTVTGVRASLTTASTSGAVSVDINVGGVSILSTVITIDQDEKTSTTAATPAVISTSAISDDAEITVDIDGAGTDAAGLKVALIGTYA